MQMFVLKQYFMSFFFNPLETVLNRFVNESLFSSLKEIAAEYRSKATDPGFDLKSFF